MHRYDPPEAIADPATAAGVEAVDMHLDDQVLAWAAPPHDCPHRHPHLAANPLHLPAPAPRPPATVCPARPRHGLEGLRAVHDFSQSFGKQLNAEDLARAQQKYLPGGAPRGPHPSRVRPQGHLRRPDLHQPHRGLEPEESRELLEFLFDRARHTEYQCRLRWRPGTIAFWDNRATPALRQRRLLPSQPRHGTRDQHRRQPRAIRSEARRRRDHGIRVVFWLAGLYFGWRWPTHPVWRGSTPWNCCSSCSSP
ncbi:TauD/TfdA dioxygenase family protein [Streptomyces sp. NPDC001777]|uniref:TauD/TfdA dioxygenase family protein n=1 Tax=Streptomyces sp. NPDC001777 TaxID=3364608 RepID=UPI0036AC0D64